MNADTLLDNLMADCTRIQKDISDLEDETARFAVRLVEVDCMLVDVEKLEAARTRRLISSLLDRCEDIVQNSVPIFPAVDTPVKVNL